MEYVPRISRIATLLADPKRSAMLWALIDGATRGADELAILAGLTPSSASAHLSKLSAAGLLKREARGRKRFFRLAAPEVGMAVEALASVPALNRGPEQASPSAGVLPGAAGALRKARICKDHLGGEVANQLYQRFVEAGWVDVTEAGASLTPRGVLELAASGIYVQAFAQRRCLSVTTCCDWCDGQPHLGGALGASLLQLFLQKGWVQRQDDSRALRMTRAGQRELGQLARPVVNAGNRLLLPA
ncbi:helix-turn-helix transcriptional regulator [Pseudomonas sp. RIT-PI-S]|uniref:ArsR/SmtB family transcription factor n=1 Tax=Pseudomonas sp. RIT-PI-S TaxID=3035295 RepID=UPI0021D7FC6A|nr:helix-turn-helix transcriptional regulator [Pseudomonas sp. RIT-PI-S]